MKTFRGYLKESLKDKQFAKEYEAQKDFLQIALYVARLRNEKKMNQKELAKKAGVTQQQLSKIENGLNCNVTTLIKVIIALDAQLNVCAAEKQDHRVSKSTGWIISRPFTDFSKFDISRFYNQSVATKENQAHSGEFPIINIKCFKEQIEKYFVLASEDISIINKSSVSSNEYAISEDRDD